MAKRLYRNRCQPCRGVRCDRRDVGGYLCIGCLGRRLGRRLTGAGFPAMPLTSFGPELSHHGPAGRAVPVDRLTADAPGVAVQLELPL